MASQTFTKNNNDNNYQLYLSLSSTTNVAGNYSTVSYTLQAKSLVSSTNYTYNNGNKFQLTINGVSLLNTTNWGSLRVPGNATVTIAAGSLQVPHTSNGTKTCSVSALWQQTQDGTGRLTMSLSGNFTCDSIPRTSKPGVSASSVTLGSPVTINTNRASTSFTHTLKWKLGSGFGTIATGVGTSYAWTVPAALASYMTTAKSASVTITCETYNGSTLVGTATVPLTANIPAAMTPTVSIAVSDATTGILSKIGQYVQGRSTLKIVATAAGTNGSSISSYKTTANGSTYTTATATTQALKASGSQTITTTVTDSRGMTKSASATISVLAYSAPSITALSVSRCNADGTANENGAYTKVTFGGTILALNNRNDKSYVLSYRRSGTTAWTIAVSATSTAYTISGSKIISTSSDYSFEFKFDLKDYFVTSSKTVTVSTGATLMSFYKDGKGLALGKVAEATNLFECQMPAKFNGAVTVAGTLNATAAKATTATTASSCSGNAVTATRLQTARTIGNASFNGTANISLAQIGAAASSHTHAYLPTGGGTVSGTITAGNYNTAGELTITGTGEKGVRFSSGGTAKRKCELYQGTTTSTTIVGLEDETGNFVVWRYAYEGSQYLFAVDRPMKATAGLTVQGSFVNNSSEAYKTDISLADINALDLINQSKIYDFRYLSDIDQGATKHHLGFIVERECPEQIISEEGDGICQYDAIAINWKATQELSAEIEKLKAENRELRETLLTLAAERKL